MKKEMDRKMKVHRFRKMSWPAKDPSEFQDPSLGSRLIDTELQRWLLRAGIAPESNWGVNRSGIYTDFN